MYKVITDTIDTYSFRTREDALAFVRKHLSINPDSEVEILDASDC